MVKNCGKFNEISNIFILSWVSAILFRAFADAWQNNQWSLSDPDSRQLVFQYSRIRFKFVPMESF